MAETLEQALQVMFQKRAKTAPGIIRPLDAPLREG